MRHNLTMMLGCVALAMAALGACDNDDQNSQPGGGDASGGAGAGGEAAGGQVPAAMAAHAIAGAFIGSCIPDDGVSNTTASLYNGWLEDIDPSCFVGKTNGCDAVDECAGLSADLAGPCLPACIGQTLEVCDDAWHFRIDCAALGGVCVPEDGDCWDLPPGPACDPSSAVARCDGDLAVYCNAAGFEEHTDCGEQGKGCSVVGDYASCVGLGPACSETPVGTCDGNEVVYCGSEAREHRVDCTELSPDLSCQTVDGEAFCGVASECNPSSDFNPDDPEHCDGTDLVFCHAGRYEKVSCPELGFSRCEELPNRTAACAPTGVLP